MLAAYHFSQTFKICKDKIKRVRRRETSVKESKEKSGLLSKFFWPVSRVSETGVPRSNLIYVRNKRKPL